MNDRGEISQYGQMANRILLALAYFDHRRGLLPIAQWDGKKLLNGTLLDRCLDAKADFVRMAEKAEFERQPWTAEEFRDLCFDGFEKILGIKGLTSEPQA